MSEEKKYPTAGNCEYRTAKDHKTEEQFRKSYDAYSWDVYTKNQRQKQKREINSFPKT
jgi:hypothetical protein